METPPYLSDQHAKEHGITNANAKRALMLRGFSEQGKTLSYSAEQLHISRQHAQRIARRFIIDFSDYRPYALKERKGLPREMKPKRNISLPAANLPLFA